MKVSIIKAALVWPTDISVLNKVLWWQKSDCFPFISTYSAVPLPLLPHQLPGCLHRCVLTCFRLPRLTTQDSPCPCQKRNILFPIFNDFLFISHPSCNMRWASLGYCLVLTLTISNTEAFAMFSLPRNMQDTKCCLHIFHNGEEKNSTDMH